MAGILGSVPAQPRFGKLVRGPSRKPRYCKVDLESRTVTLAVVVRPGSRARWAAGSGHAQL